MTTIRDIVLRVPSDVLSGLALLTRLPLPDHQGTGAASAWSWPLVGAVLGGIGAALASGALWLGVTPGVTAALVLALGVMLTGGLHEDGLSDSADGLYGGWTRERRLEIMKDSRVGSYGALALVLVMLARWSALTALLVHGGPTQAHWAALIATGALSRAPMALIMALLPNARGKGLSHATGRPSLAVAWVGIALAVAIAALLVGWMALGLAVAALGTGVVVSVAALRRIGGQTGDILGATQQLAETACLAVLSAAAR